MKISDDQYLADCNDFFAPLDEIAETLRDQCGMKGLSYDELLMLVESNSDMNYRIKKYL